MRGARVIIACRDVDKARKAVKEIKARSHSVNVHYMELDLANMRAIREFCTSFLQKEKKLDILINNAGEVSPSAVCGDPETLGYSQIELLVLLISTFSA